MKNILITGATGFIGKHFIKRLLEQGGYNIVALVRPSSNLSVINDYLDNITIHHYKDDYKSIESLFQQISFDYVFHFAALSKYDYKVAEISSMLNSNITFGTFLLEAMKRYNCSYFINTSTYWQHYQDHNYQPICLYAATKAAFENIVDYYCMDSKIKAITLKLYDVYGYDDHRGKLLNVLIKQQDPDKVFDLTAGEQKLYMVFIDDVINALLSFKLLNAVISSEFSFSSNSVKILTVLK